jgi:hypothetical protein
MGSRRPSSAITHTPNGEKWQVWRIENTVNNCVNLVNTATGRCLDSNNQGFVNAQNCNGGNSQNWKFQNQLVINCETNLCLTSGISSYSRALDCGSVGRGQNWLDE